MKKNESGRSMVEMLAVLGIIGVLSIGGYTGYTLAIKRINYSKILNTASILQVKELEAKAFLRSLQLEWIKLGRSIWLYLKAALFALKTMTLPLVIYKDLEVSVANM